MNHRLAFATELESGRDQILRLLKHYPVEITYDTKDATQEGFRIVIDKPAELELAVTQLRAPTVTPAEALNQSLVLE